MRLIIYCDESSMKGERFSNFYGGLLVRSDTLDAVEAHLQQVRARLGLLGEVKWQKISLAYRDRYIEFIDAFFDLVEADHLKVRIMFLQNVNKRVRKLTPYQKMHAYFMLYYQFLKHAFGLQYHDLSRRQEIAVDLRLDQLPDAPDKIELFKRYVARLQRQRQFREARIAFDIDNMAEICSHDHVMLQCLDVVLGAMQFRLNERHKYIPPGQCRRGQRTKAKADVYRHVLMRIHRIYPRFNIGTSTGIGGSIKNRWNHPYRHWSFRTRPDQDARQAA